MEAFKIEVKVFQRLGRYPLILIQIIIANCNNLNYNNSFPMTRLNIKVVV